MSSRNVPTTRALQILAAAIDAVIAYEKQAAALQVEQARDAERLAMAFGAPVEVVGGALDLSISQG
jgi:hypothetical protein